MDDQHPNARLLGNRLGTFSSNAAASKVRQRLDQLDYLLLMSTQYTYVLCLVVSYAPTATKSQSCRHLEDKRLVVSLQEIRKWL